MRVACYVDGFNMYHAIHDLNKPHLKWVNFWSLSESLCRPGETLIKVAYFSAYATWRPAAYARHRTFVTALTHAGVDCHMARFNTKEASCHGCGRTWKQREEKETDVHFALTFLEDAIDNVFDRAIIMSADSDYMPAVRKVRNRLPGKQIFLASPPRRHGHARDLIAICNSSTPITAGRLARCLFPAQLLASNGQTVVSRPPEYDPPV